MIDLELYRKKLTVLCPQEICIMEVCGTHTMAIAKAGIKNILPGNIHLISGPGCPVCVTDQADIDAMMALSEEKDVVIATYGDMIRVPGSQKGDSLAMRRAKGAAVEVVYSAMDALTLAKDLPDKEVVFIGVGFETTVPGTAAAIKQAADDHIGNFSVFSMMKKLEPALHALIRSPGFSVDAFLCPGHVAVILGEKGFEFLPEQYGLPAVISGFEPADILLSVYEIARQISQASPSVYNEYKRAVTYEGNSAALAALREVFESAPAKWRGLGEIPESAFAIRRKYSAFDAETKFSFRREQVQINTLCRCGDVICGRITPKDCALFGTACTPEDPVGPCMVSSEGSCAAACKYGNL